MEEFIKFANNVEEERKVVVTDEESVKKVVVEALIDDFLFNKEKLNEVLDDCYFGWSSENPDNLDKLYKLCSAYEYYIDKLTNFKMVHSVGGCEGGGENVERILKVTSPSSGNIAYIRATGWYSSYEGTEWDTDVTFMTPVAKMIVDFE